MSNRTSYLLAVLLLLLTTFLRLWQIPTLPIGFSDPELHQIDLMQDRTLQGEIRVFYETDDGGQEGLYQVLLALAGVAFGTGTLGLRLIGVFASLLAVSLMYSLGVRLFGRWAGVAAAAFLSVNLAASLLARTVLVESLLPLLITAVLLSLARAFPVYQRLRAETSNTIDYAALGTVLGIGLYLHPVGILLVLMAMLFIMHILGYRARISLRRISYIGFSLLMLIIVSTPYLLSSARLPELAAGERILGNYQGLLTSTWRSLGGIFLVGDHSVLLNVIDRPLIDLVSGFLVLIGLALCVRYWRHARYTLPLLAGILLLPTAVLVGNAPNFTSLAMLLPALALYFGLGFSVLLRNIPQRVRWVGVLAALGLLVFNIGWVGRDLFLIWPEQEAVYEVYNGRFGQIAHHIDTSADDVPTVLCYPNWNTPHMPGQERTAVDRVLLHMNRSTAGIRYVDCLSGLVFADGGAAQQVIIPSLALYDQIPPNIADWLAQGTPLDSMPERAVILLDVQEQLADALGVFTTTAPASYESSVLLPDSQLIPPPIRFAGNLTWLGYDSDPQQFYAPGGLIPVTTYWRVEGILPPDVTIFTHILSDPVTIVANRDTISTDPSRLRERDILIQLTGVRLPETVFDGQHEVSIGIYQNTDDERLSVFDEIGTIRGNRIFLYPITIVVDSE